MPVRPKVGLRHIGPPRSRSVPQHHHRLSAVGLVHLLPWPALLSWENFSDLRNALNSSSCFFTSSRSPRILMNHTWSPVFSIAASVASFDCDSSCFFVSGIIGAYVA